VWLPKYLEWPKGIRILEKESVSKRLKRVTVEDPIELGLNSTPPSGASTRKTQERSFDTYEQSRGDGLGEKRWRRLGRGRASETSMAAAAAGKFTLQGSQQSEGG